MKELKELVIFVAGCILIAPSFILLISASLLGMAACAAYSFLLIRSIKHFPYFWEKWLTINGKYSHILDGGKVR